MVNTIDDKTIHVKDLAEDEDPMMTQWDAWENEEYVRKVRVVGTVKKWTLSCWEKNVAWDNSVCKYLKEKMAADTKVLLVIDIVFDTSKLHYVPATWCHVIGANVAYSEEDWDYREFTVTLQKASILEIGSFDVYEGYAEKQYNLVDVDVELPLYTLGAIDVA